jgi:hypothetical protein
MRGRCWLGLFVVAGCTTDHGTHSYRPENVTLDAFATGDLEVFVDYAGTGTNTAVTVYLALPPPTCPILTGNVTATVDEIALSVSPGMYLAPNPGALNAHDGCDPPMFSSGWISATSTASTITIGDGATTISATVPLLRTVRKFTAGPAITPTLQRGMDVTFAWSVSTDTVEPNDDGSLPQPGLKWTVQGAGNVLELGPAYAVTGLAVQGTTLVASIPSNADTGYGVFDFVPLFSPSVTACTGVTSCRGEPVAPPRMYANLTP